MTEVVKTKIFHVPAEELLKTILDVTKYPNFVPGVDGIELIETLPNKDMRVRYSLNLVKSFTYVIVMRKETETKVSWELEGGDLFKKNTGSWTLRKIDSNQTEVTYSLDLAFKIFAPGIIISKLTEQTLPQVLVAFENRTKDLMGKVSA